MIKKHLTIKDLPDEERPYEKLEKSGPSYLTDGELLAILLKNGAKNLRSIDLAYQLLSYAGSLNQLSELNFKDLIAFKGIGKVKAIQILAMFEISKRIVQSKAKDKLHFSNPESIANYYMEQLRHYKQEHLLLVMLDTKNNIIKDSIIFKGSVNATLVEPREIFLEALKNEAVYIILLHNHPSGDPTPSKEDLYVTKKIKEAGQLIGIHLLDHIIIGDRQFESFRIKSLL